MSGRTRFALSAVVAALILAVAVGPAVAGQNGPNNQNAKKCQKGGWKALYTSSGGTFANQSECVSYAAKGGRLFSYAGQAVCAQLGGTFVLGTARRCGDATTSRIHIRAATRLITRVSRTGAPPFRPTSFQRRISPTVSISTAEPLSRRPPHRGAASAPLGACRSSSRTPG